MHKRYFGQSWSTRLRFYLFHSRHMSTNHALSAGHAHTRIRANNGIYINGLNDTSDT